MIAALRKLRLRFGDFFSKICFAWVLFSVVLLAIVGYGASENGFILYSYYFSWAFISGK